MTAFEANFDGLIGPTHNYAGLSADNVASEKNKSRRSNPRQAALQGLKKMRVLSKLGLIQGFLPPQERPTLQVLRQLGFTGTNQRVLAKAAQQAPELLASCYSAASMWAANAATTSASADTADGKVHFTPANLVSNLHRAIEHSETSVMLQKIFHDPRYFIHHSALPASNQLADEGAANHTRFCTDHCQAGVSLFVFGSDGFKRKTSSGGPKSFSARQTHAASAAIARQHQLCEQRIVFAQQNPEVIDQGVFHNDVIAVGNLSTFFCHEKAFLNQSEVYRELQAAYGCEPLSIIEVAEQEVSVADAVETYLFNSQLLSINNKQLLLVPSECYNNMKVAHYLAELVDRDNPITDVKSIDIRQSMRNGGGPACLRLRVVMTTEELAAIHAPCLFSEGQYGVLKNWIEKHYRDRLEIKDLADPLLLEESRCALDDLSQRLKLGSIYAFQR